MNLDGIMSLLGDFDLEKLIPDLGSVLGKLELATRIGVMIGPLVLLGLGLWYFFAPPKEANYEIGYRAIWNMRSKEAWYFSQKIAGMVWTVLGFILTVVMLLISIGYRGMDAMEMAQSAFACILWEAGLILASSLGIHIAVIACFDWEGKRRRPPKSKKRNARRERPAR